ncbi:MAG: 2,3-bisphosphoglycerate-independent phosphoglycerate mutase [Candidatus Magasanikbacteria bacterium CG10_big_fil_rev_8_21_14_0_10_43_6]|uniref:2,3-bisphosphoglycerate-independent phosphoglycerate mutase n=1 Tax=Candidatus Magasanikbacteria bacterium CG10_big_fil_rev_8_21_14_0_10_43_6 TaxID=1974650 RepID=A0A2M6W1M3_9BACT|nr:MAG: 2,3-bisphosphoglycerate-independent phosphoglycerate mutase [Candidatus Magasanikbacteria bacterium CG10_big_fil_rev_8_21_14_0_10_43_6]
MDTSRPKPVVLAILDGWGVAPPSSGNAIGIAKTPNMDRFVNEFPVMTILASGNEVGLSFGEMGNSEVGHLNIGAGRVYYQTFPRINKSIFDGEFFENPAFLEATDHVKANKSALHLIGLVSPGNVHAAQDHLYALLELAKKQKVKTVYVHAILDGRDVQYNTAPDFIGALQQKMKEISVGKIASLSGRYWALDRDNRWDRVQRAYSAIARGIAEEYYTDPLKAIESSYAKKVYDEEFAPVVIGKEGKPTGPVSDGDAVIFFNFRPDRARELTKAFVLPSFPKFDRPQIQNLFFTTMSEYEKDVPVSAIAFPPDIVQNCLAEAVSKAGLKQFHIAETEKYAHITFFLNGTIEEPFPGEERQIIPSPQVSSYDQAPEMSAPEVGKETIKAIESDKYDAIFVNFANADMVAHTGNLEASIKGCEAIDKAIGEIAEHTIAKGGVLLITADHGNGEELLNLETGDMDKEHSTNPVPLFIISRDLQGQAGPAGEPPEGDLSLMPPVGMLADVAPTVLKILNVPQPPEMSGRALI